MNPSVSDRTGVCIACGLAVAQHFDGLNYWIGCAGARRVQQSLQPMAPPTLKPQRDLQLVGGARDGGRQEQV